MNPFEDEYTPPPQDEDEKRVLVVDDDPEILDILKNVLRQYYKVRTSKNSLEAMQIALEWKPNLLIIDWMMPRMPGNQLVQTLRSKPDLKDIPVIFISAKSGEAAQKMVSKFKVQEFITKPFEAYDILKAAMKYLN